MCLGDNTKFRLVAFVIIGLAVFGGDYPNYVSNVSGTAVNRRWGYWLFVPISIFLPFAALFFPFNYIYTNYISNRMFHAVGLYIIFKIYNLKHIY